MKVRLGDIFDLQMGKTPSRNNSDYWGGKNKWVSISDLSACDKYILETKECITDKALCECGIKKTPTNTVLMSFKLSIGKVAITASELYTNEAIMAFIDKGIYQFNENYLYYLFSGIDWTEGSNKAVKGLTLNKATLSQKYINLPSLEIQLEIVKKLDKVTALIEKCKQQLEKLDLLVKSKFIEMFGDPIVNEKGWATGKLSDVAELKIGPFGSVLHKDDYVVGGHALINPSHIVNGKIVPDTALTLSDDKYNELSAYQLKENDIVLGRRGEMGRCAVVHEKGLFCGTGSMIVRPNGKIHSYFLQSVLSSSSMKILIEERAVGVTMANLNVPIVANLPIPIYPMAKQKEYIELLQLTDKTKLKIKQSLEKFDILKKALMQKYFG